MYPLDEDELQQKLKKFDQELPHFPDGRIDYSEADTALAVGIIVLRGDKLLLVKRSQDVGFYPGKWNWPSGFIDEAKPLEKLVYQELREETGISSSSVEEVFFASPIEIVDDEINKTWLIYPVVIAIKSGTGTKLSWEAEEYDWVRPDELKGYDTIPGVVENINTALKQYHTHD